MWLATGGQVVGQALAAATRTVPNTFHVHSLHSYFLLPGDSSVPILYHIARTRDGRSFATRTVTAIQHGRNIFTCQMSFQVPEENIMSHEVRCEPADVAVARVGKRRR